MYKKPELLSPAGSLKNMRYAFAYGADAVYAGQPRYSLRVRNNEFNHQNLAFGINEAHSLGKKFYVVVNIAPHNSKLKTFLRDIQPIIEMKPDALIMSDPGLIMIIRENFPKMPIHLSVQANAVNWATVQFWQKMGVERVILSRELSLDEIQEIRQKVPEMELEIFVHGALCMAYSGRCLLSGYINHRDSNQGTCTNACRWKYKIEEGEIDDIGNIVQKFNPNENIPIDPTLGIGKTTSNVFVLEETKNPGEKISAFEDEHGSYLMNSKDLRAVQHVNELTKMGIHSLKIEGRTKSYYYCARTAQIYRKAIDDAVQKKPFDKSLLKQLDSLANRGYTEGFLNRHSHESYQNYEYGHSVSYLQQFVGEFTGITKNGFAEIIVKNKFSVGDSAEIMSPKGNVSFNIEVILDKNMNSISAGLGDGHTVFIKIPENISLEFALLLRNLENQTTRNPYNN